TPARRRTGNSRRRPFGSFRKKLWLVRARMLSGAAGLAQPDRLVHHRLLLEQDVGDLPKVAQQPVELAFESGALAGRQLGDPGAEVDDLGVHALEVDELALDQLGTEPFEDPGDLDEAGLERCGSNGH